MAHLFTISWHTLLTPDNVASGRFIARLIRLSAAASAVAFAPTRAILAQLVTDLLVVVAWQNAVQEYVVMTINQVRIWCLVVTMLLLELSAVAEQAIFEKASTAPATLTPYYSGWGAYNGRICTRR